MGNIKYYIIPRPIYDDGGWLATDFLESSYNKANDALNLTSGILKTAGSFMGSVGNRKWDNKSIFSNMDTLEMTDANGLKYYYTSDSLGWNKRFGLGSEGFYLKEDPNGGWRIYDSKPHSFANGGWGMAGGITSAVGDALNNFSESSRIDDATINGAKLGIQLNISTPVTANNFDSLMEEQANQRNLKTNWSRKDFLGTNNPMRIIRGLLGALDSGARTAMSTGNIWAGIGAAVTGGVANILGTIRANRQAKKQANIANRYSSVGNAYMANKTADRNDYLKDLLNDNLEWYYKADGGFISTPGSEETIGVDDINISELTENQEVEGLSKEDIRKLRKLGYKFDIIG